MRLRSLHRAYPSLHPSGVVHWVPEQLNIKAVTGACKLIDGCSLVLCSTTVSVVSAGICHRNIVNSTAWLYRKAQPKDSIIYITLHYIGHLWYPWCCWPGLRGLARSPRYVGRVRHGWSWYLAGAAGNIFRDGWHGSGMATIIPYRPITAGLLQWGSLLNRLDHYRRTARQCPWTVTVLALLSRRTTNRQPAWSRYPLLCWWWTNLRLRQGRSSRWDDQ